MNKANHAISRGGSPEMESKLMHFIQDYACRYVGGMSSSLPMEQMQVLAASAIYQITYGMAENGISNPAQALMQTDSLTRLQKQGIVALKKKIHETQQIFQRIQRERIKIPQRAYQDTLMKGIPLFFSEYDVEYAAHETPGSIDYQLADPIDNASGIVFISDYLHQLDLENQFCRLVSPIFIHRLLKAFDERYEAHLENQFEHVLMQMIGKILLNHDPRELIIRSEDLQMIDNLLRSLSSSELEYAWMHAGIHLAETLNLQETRMQAQIENQLLQQFPRVKNALKHHAIDRIWTVVL